MKKMIITKKAKKKEELSKNITNTIIPAEVTQAISYINFAGRYICAISNADLNAIR